MKVVLTQAVEIALRTLTGDDLKAARHWIRRLEKWGSDPAIARNSHELATPDNVYLLEASPEIRLFYSVGEDEINVLDVASRDTLQMFRQPTGSGKA
jgi:hypothetical protein